MGLYLFGGNAVDDILRPWGLRTQQIEHSSSKFKFSFYKIVYLAFFDNPVFGALALANPVFVFLFSAKAPTPKNPGVLPLQFAMCQCDVLAFLCCIHLAWFSIAKMLASV